MRTANCPVCNGASVNHPSKCTYCQNTGLVTFQDIFAGPEPEAKDVVEVKQPSNYDKVYHPQHYTSHPSGIECKDVAGDMPFFLGSAIKYLWRCDQKHPDPIEDLEKAKQYITFEIERRKRHKI